MVHSPSAVITAITTSIALLGNRSKRIEKLGKRSVRLDASGYPGRSEWNPAQPQRLGGIQRAWLEKSHIAGDPAVRGDQRVEPLHDTPCASCAPFANKMTFPATEPQTNAQNVFVALKAHRGSHPAEADSDLRIVELCAIHVRARWTIAQCFRGLQTKRAANRQSAFFRRILVGFALACRARYRIILLPRGSSLRSRGRSRND